MPDFIAFGIVLDDLVYPDGRNFPGLLGGGGPQTAFGMRLWSDSVGLCARAGPDLPASALDWLDQNGIERSRVIQTGLPTLRARQRLEADGRRTQTWLVPPHVVSTQLNYTLEDLHDACRAGRGFHLGIHPEHPRLSFITALAGAGALASIETFKPAEGPLSEEDLAAIFEAVGIFSPNLAEAVSLVGPGRPEELLGRMGCLGARVIALRMGARGALLTCDAGAHSLHMPALPVTVVDPLGAGNAFCGGFLVGWCLHQDLRTAGIYAAVSASFLLEQPGLPPFSTIIQREASRRRADLSNLF